MDGKDYFSWIERFYTYFIGRDIAYVFAGAALIWNCLYIADCQNITPFFETKSYLPSIGFLAGSYFVGFAISEFSDWIGLIDKKGRKCYRNYFTEKLKMFQKNNDKILNLHERTIILMHFGASVGVSLFISGIILGLFGLIKYEGIFYFFLILFIIQFLTSLVFIACNRSCLQFIKDNNKKVLNLTTSANIIMTIVIYIMFIILIGKPWNCKQGIYLSWYVSMNIMGIYLMRHSLWKLSQILIEQDILNNLNQ